ncbi:MAG: DCC1-like thiol-disulfide oxidoreductase family protein [Luteolibacter sp.]
MKTLTIFYDPRCGLCVRFRAWLEAQPKRVAVEFLAYDCAEAGSRFPGLLALGADKDVVVLADDGRWWQGSPAWLTCLWTTWEYRAWSFRLAAPVFQPLVKKAVHLLSENRLAISRLFSVREDWQLAAALDSVPSPACGGDACKL